MSGTAQLTLPLLVLGAGADARSERGVACPGELPAQSDPALVLRAERARAALGDRAFVLGHHYQRDEVIRFADVTGDSFKLAKDAAARPGAEFVIFCGVHFMAESADILTSADQRVILPDLGAGCSMADMASYHQVEECWETLEDLGIAGDVVPVTYMNSSADIKAFTGRHGGTVCTSSNAKRALTWARGKGRAGTGGKVLFLPDQHLGRNTAVLEARDVARRLRGLGPGAGRTVASTPRGAAPGHDDLVEGALLGARPVPGREPDRGSAPGPRRQRDRPP